MDPVRVAAGDEAEKPGDDARSDRGEVGAAEGRGGVSRMGRGGFRASTTPPAAPKGSRQDPSKSRHPRLRGVALGRRSAPNRANDPGARHESLARDRARDVAGLRGGLEARAVVRRARGRDGVAAIASSSRQGFPGVARGAPVGRVRQPARSPQPRAHDGQEPPRVRSTLDRGRGREEGERRRAAAVPGSEARGAAVVPPLVLGRLRLGHTERAREHTGQHGERDGRRLLAAALRHTRRAASAARRRRLV
mmetsp:Transcript_2354/g.9545  ORF Transcript_2354/g.9545 Transcript_2354/m.9545 type:complete len:250 (-) Transcript_2354:244-993(-)